MYNCETLMYSGYSSSSTKSNLDLYNYYYYYINVFSLRRMADIRIKMITDLCYANIFFLYLQ